MEDIKDYLEKANAKHWARLRKHPPAFLKKIGKEITTEKMHEIIREDAKALTESIKARDERLETIDKDIQKADEVMSDFDKLESILAKLDKCIEIQEKNIQTLDYINEIITLK